MFNWYHRYGITLIGMQNIEAGYTYDIDNKIFRNAELVP